jgi:4'-phosphopantetheinyl transferase EntD
VSDLAALVAAAREMLPPGVGLGWADLRLDHPALPGEALPRAIPRRQREFAAGRAAARMAMGRPDQPLPMRPDRAPLWPAGIVGSISHSDSACLAIAAPRTQFRGLGLDLEPDVPLDRDLWETVLVAGEREWLEALPEADQGASAKLIFAAKEAVYKAQYAISEHLFGFEGVEIRISEQSFTARLLAEISRLPAGTQFRGRRILSAASITSGRSPAPPASITSNRCRRMRGSQKSLICDESPATASSCGFDSMNLEIWLAI